MPPTRQPAKPVAAVPARRPPVRTPPRPTPAPLQSRIGNSGVQKLRLQQRAAAPAPAKSGAAPGPHNATGAAAARSRRASGPHKGAPPAAAPKPAAYGPPGPAKARGAPKPGAKRAKGRAPAAAGPGHAHPPTAAAPAAAGAPGKSGRFAALKAKIAGAASHHAKAPPARAAVGQAQAAAVAPGPAAETEAATHTVDTLAGAPTATIEAAAFKKALLQKLEQLMPKPANAEAAQAALSNGAAETAGAAMQGQLGAEQAKATGGLAAAAAAPANPGEFPQATPPPLAPLQPGAPPPVPPASGAVPDPVPAAALDTSASKAESDARLASAGVTDAQLARSNEPGFGAALTARAAAVEHGTAGAAAVRTQEGAIGAGAEAKGGGLLARGMAGFGAARSGAFGRVGAEQAKTRAKDEAERKRIAADLTKIQTATRAEVETHLATMDSIAKQMLASGLDEALKAFEAERQRLETRAKEKMAEDSFFGSLSMLWSKLDQADLDAAVAGARAAYQRVVDRTIDLVATYVGNVMAVVKAVIARGRAAAEAYVKALPAAVRAIGETALAKVSESFDALATQVDERRDALIDDLGAQAAEAAQKVEERVEAFREANKGFWQRVKEAVEGVLKTLAEMKRLLASIAAKAAGVADTILSDPIGFLGNLIGAVRKGLDKFTGNFLTHLKAGFFEWLFGQAAEAGIEIPKKFDAAGIFSLIAGVLGLTLANFRARAVQKLGAPFVDALEKGAEIFLVWKNEGFAGLWRMLKEKLEAMKEQALEQIQSMLMTQVIEAGVMWLIGLLNPAAALIKACKAIYEIVMFFVNNGKRILEFVNAVLDSLGAIAAGKIDDAAAKVEGALARTIPLAIGFLASLLGLGKISEKVKKIIEKLQAPVNKAIDWLLDKAVSLLKKAGGAIKGLFGKDKAGKKPATTSDPAHDAAVAAGLAQIGEEEAREGGGKLTAKAAEHVAARVKAKHKVFKAITVREAKHRWVYHYVASEGEHNGANVDQPTKLEPTPVIAFDPSAFSGNDLKEFKRQLAEQEKTLNGMDILRWLNNRALFVEIGRHPDSAPAQKELRANAILKRATELVIAAKAKEEELSLNDAKAMAAAELKGVAAAHHLDLVAGGDATSLSFGKSNVNSSIGSQWKAAARIGQLQAAVNAFCKLHALSAKQKAEVKMSVQLTPK